MKNLFSKETLGKIHNGLKEVEQGYPHEHDYMLWDIDAYFHKETNTTAFINRTLVEKIDGMPNGLLMDIIKYYVHPDKHILVSYFVSKRRLKQHGFNEPYISEKILSKYIEMGIICKTYHTDEFRNAKGHVYLINPAIASFMGDGQSIEEQRLIYHSQCDSEKLEEFEKFYYNVLNETLKNRNS